MFISYTQCFVLHIRAVISKVTCLLNYIEKNRGGGLNMYISNFIKLY